VRFEDTGNLPHSAWLQTSQDIDASHTLRALSGGAAVGWWWITCLDARWESSPATQCPASWPSMISRTAGDCAALLDQNVFPDMDTRYAGKYPGIQLMLGPAYGLLRDEFSRLRESMRIRRGPVRRILVLMGGADAEKQTEKAIEAIARLRGRSFEVDVVIGKLHPAREKLAELCRRHGFSLHVQTADVAALMALADLAIGAAGSSSWSAAASARRDMRGSGSAPGGNGRRFAGARRSRELGQRSGCKR
jgi:hypothetical protein